LPVLAFQTLDMSTTSLSTPISHYEIYKTEQRRVTYNALLHWQYEMLWGKSHWQTRGKAFLHHSRKLLLATLWTCMRY